VAILGGFFAVAGAVLASLGGSPYYLIAGVAMVVSGALLGRHPRYGRWLFVAIWVGTLIWAIWEVGFDGLQLVPRLVAPTVLLVLVLLTGWSGRFRQSHAYAMPAAVGVLLTLGVCGIAINGEGVEAQEAASSAAIPNAPTGEADGDWRDYGGTPSGRRYSALADITPQNVGRLELAWTQRTGDLPMEAETKEHKREYHSEATPIHIGDTLYTCTPHSFVQAIDATTGKTKWSWHEDAKIEGNNYLVCRGVTYFEAPAGTPCPRRIFAPTFNARLVALDADTGRPCVNFANRGAIDLRANMGTSKPSDQIGTTPR
jgi:quinoprotein glucose dehydrogenase